MALSDHLERVQERLRKGDIRSEMAVIQVVLWPVLDELGWPVGDTNVVYPEYSLGGRRVDYALCHPAERPVVFIEVKNVGLSDGAARQLFEYVSISGVPMAVLTDGREWSFFLPGERGSYDERMVCKLQLLQQDVDDAAGLLERYLSYDRVCSGESLDAARSDYQEVVRARETAGALPRTWRALLEEPDSLLLDLLADKYEELNGDKPDLGSCRRFLMDKSKSIVTTTPSAPLGSQVTLPKNREPVTRVTVDPKSDTVHDTGLVKLSEFFPLTTEKPPPPRSLRLPDQSERQIIKWYDIFVEVTEWLIGRGMVTAEACPITLNGQRYIIHYTPFQANGDPFRSSRKLSNGLYLYTHESSAGLVRLSNRLLRKFNQDPAQFIVRRR